MSSLWKTDMFTLDAFKTFYAQLSVDTLMQLPELYDEHAVFVDPIGTVNGIQPIQHYFAQLLMHTSACHTEIEQAVEKDDHVFLTWRMRMNHPRLNRGQTIAVDGMSHLRVSDKVTYHRDYFDLGAMVYQHVPVLGFVIKRIRQRMHT